MPGWKSSEREDVRNKPWGVEESRQSRGKRQQENCRRKYLCAAGRGCRQAGRGGLWADAELWTRTQRMPRFGSSKHLELQ